MHNYTHDYVYYYLVTRFKKVWLLLAAKYNVINLVSWTNERLHPSSVSVTSNSVRRSLINVLKIHFCYNHQCIATQ